MADRLRLLSRVALTLLGAVLVACSQTSGPDKKIIVSTDPVLDPDCLPSINVDSRGDVVRLADIDGRVALNYTVAIDATDPKLYKPVNVAADDEDAGLTEQQPQFGAARISAPVFDVTLDAAIKRPTQRQDLVWLDWFVINDSDEGIAEAEFRITGLDPAFVVYDLGADLWAPPLDQTTVVLGSVAPEGVTRLVMGIGTADGSSLTEREDALLEFSVTLTGRATTRVATRSQRIAITPDGAEVWAPLADANRVFVVDTAQGEAVAEIEIEGSPRGMALTPDGQFALTVAPRCNQLVVIDRARREVVQRFGEAEGIGREPRELVLSPDGSRVYVSSLVGDSIAAFERREQGFTQIESFDVGRRPTGLSVSPDGGAIFVAHLLARGPMPDNEAWISVHDAQDFSLLTDQASVADPGNLEPIACLRQLDRFADYTPVQLGMESPFTGLHGAFLNPSGTEAVVPATVIVPFLMFEGDMVAAGIDRPLGRITSSNILTFDARVPGRTHVRQLDSTFDIRDRDLEFQRCVNRNANIEYPDSYTHADRPGIVTSNGASLPTGETSLLETGQIRSLAFTRGGRRVIFLSYTTDEVAVVDGSTYHSLARTHFVLSGSNPAGIALTPDGNTGYVLYDNSLFLSVIDTSAYVGDGALPRPVYVPFWISRTLNPQASASLVSYGRITRDVRDVPIAVDIAETRQIQLLTDDPVDAKTRRGRILFSSAHPDKYPELTGHREGGCLNCHIDGGPDGSMWVTIEGERRTPNLRGGVGGRGWLHAQATHQDAHEIVDILTRERLGGSGLNEYDLDALASYVAWGIPRLQAPATDPELVVIGEALFDAHCTECHVDAFTELSRGPTELRPYGGGGRTPEVHDVGTQTDYAGASMGQAHQDLFARIPIMGEVFTTVVGDRAMGPDDVVFTLLHASPRPVRAANEFKAASLVNVWDHELYFHDGRFHELREAVEYMNDVNESGLSDAEITAVVEYLRSF